MMRQTHRYHQSREQYMSQQESEMLRRIKDPAFIERLRNIKTRKVGNVTILETITPQSIFASAQASYLVTLQQSKKPDTLARRDARESAKNVLEQFEYFTIANLNKIINSIK